MCRLSLSAPKSLASKRDAFSFEQRTNHGGEKLNKKFLEHYMNTEPKVIEQKYIFLVDNEYMAMNIIANGYQAVALIPDNNGYHSIDSFFTYMDSIAFSGKCRNDYCYVPACFSKNENDALEKYFKQEYLQFQIGWRLFKNKEYLEKMENQNELKAILSNFIMRFEQNFSEQPNLNRFHKFNEEGKRIGVFDMEIVDYLIQTIPFFIIGNTPYVYSYGYYQEDHNGVLLKSHIQKLLFRDCIKSTTIQSIYTLLISQPQIYKKFSDLNNQPPHWINFKNGYFDVMQWKIIEHDAKYLMINQIPYFFYPEQHEEIRKQENIIKHYLDSSLPDEDDQQTFWQYLGYCMTTDTRFQKFLMIKGKGGTGKSIAIALIQHIVGTENYSSISLQDLNKRFYATGLFGKQLNACADIPCTAMQNVDILKKAVGEDTLLYEKKGQDPTQFRSYAKLLFSANEMPLNLDDKTNAYYRRLLVLDMNHLVSVSKKDAMLKEKIYKETDYAIHMGVAALKQLYIDNYFCESLHSQECIQELYRSADSVKAFLDEKICQQKETKLKRSELYQLYTKFCEENDRQAHGKSVFFRIMSDKGYILKRDCNGFYYENLSLKENNFVKINNTEKIPFE